MKVPFFDARAEHAHIRTDIERAIARVIDSGVFIGGPEVEAFERELATAAGVREVIGVSSGTDALYVLYLAFGIGRGDEVVTSPFTFFATAGGIARRRARVVFADIDDTLTMDPAAALAAVTSRTKLIVPVSLFGHPATPPACSLPIVEDAAQSIGAPAPPRVAAALSFFPTKTLGALGDAGAVLTDDRELAARIRRLRAHGAEPKYHHVEIGGNFRLDAIQAAILRTKLPHLPTVLARRRSHANLYRELFAAARVPPELRLPAEHRAHTYHQFTIQTPRRDALRAALLRAGIETQVYYPEPLHLQPCFADLGYRAGAFPRAERACREVLSLPIAPSAGPDALAYVVQQVEAFFAG